MSNQENKKRISETYVTRNERTFETRLLFLYDLFSEPYEQIQIMTSCVKYKLDTSLDEYLWALHKVDWAIKGKDPMKLLKKVDG